MGPKTPLIKTDTLACVGRRRRQERALIFKIDTRDLQAALDQASVRAQRENANARGWRQAALKISRAGGPNSMQAEGLQSGRHELKPSV
jgi:hypothetical protein